MAIAAAPAPNTQPASREVNPDQMLKQLLSPSRPQRPLEPVDYPADKEQTSTTAIAPKAEVLNLVREGTFIVDRAGRFTKTADGQKEFTFESDGAAMKDPPMIILPNLKLMLMETQIKTVGRDLRFLVTGMVTEYNSRNYILLEKVVVIPDGSTPTSVRRRDRDSDDRQR
jgi:hypothetical protein